MKRLILSILAGFIKTAELSTAVDEVFHSTGIYPPYGQPFLDTPLVLIAFTYRALFAILGSYLTAVIAKDQAKKAVLILGSIGSVLWLVGGIVMWDFAPAWYNLGGVITGIPFALIGGKLYELRARQLR
jgi:hypothetical protein